MDQNTAEVLENNLLKNPKLKEDQKAVPLPSLQSFLEEWDFYYSKKINDIPLLNLTMALNWTDAHKQYFTKILYHARGRLYKFLWHMGNIAPDVKAKELVLYNYAEEFGGRAPSHEQLYLIFAADMGVTSPHEVTDKKYYLPFFQEYNIRQMDWLEGHDWDGCLAAFAAYERLDNIDYAKLLLLAKHLGASKRGLIFFKAHCEVEHFSAATPLLNETWMRNESIVRQAFKFIADEQANMWSNLSRAAFEYAEQGGYEKSFPQNSVVG